MVAGTLRVPSATCGATIQDRSRNHRHISPVATVARRWMSSVNGPPSGDGGHDSGFQVGPRSRLRHVDCSLMAHSEK